ncbi:hypothetical protein AC579_10450 [Pseudocercospora musae]|uniref:Uncharacterized protein n=1 Tax=Pseudocercospora musae TaxID=113226 RepID=A0A139I039_9PEZI|nr:hypothetical protein AC579_10450 [Pseudocercospora musae]
MTSEQFKGNKCVAHYFATFSNTVCGCRAKGEFKQCDEKYNAQTNLQCATTTRDEQTSRNYCPKHMPKDNKATTQYTTRQPVTRS